MFTRSIRLFSVRLSFSFEFRLSRPRHHRYQICYLPYTESEKPIASYKDFSSNSLNTLLKAIPEEAKRICEEVGEDCWVGIVDNDNQGKIVAQVSTDLHDTEIVVSRHAVVSEIVFLK